MSFMLAFLETIYDPTLESFTLMVLGQEVCCVAIREFWHLIKYGIDLLCHCVKKKQALPIHALIYHDEAQTHQCQLFLEQLAQVSEHQPDSEEIHWLKEPPKLQCMRPWLLNWVW
jgi:hypothetical protein